MFTVLAELKVRPDKIDDAKVAFRRLMQDVKAAEPGTLTYTIHQRTDNPAIFVVYEQYTDEAAFQTHMGNLGKHAATFAAVLEGAPQASFLQDI